MSKVYLVVTQCDGYVSTNWFKKKANAERCLGAQDQEAELEELIVNGSITNLCYYDSEYELCPKCNELEQFDCECEE
tara:strand:- start:296 stop:526 length:231 start_codon:yes stop_codon:yes gene_type:complete